MEIKDIIQSKRDRLFVISPECYIIFTGDSLKDEHPFIRIGNSQELQREVITLIENIIYPGLPTGSPLDEQFNLDIPHLPKNRYLGKSSAIQNFLDFQKLYDPDIDEVKIYDIQKDGSELLQQQVFLENKSYVGIFYTNGNFEIVHDNEPLFDLKETRELYCTDNKINSLISEHWKDSTRYTGTGFVLMDSSLLFYSNNYFTSYNAAKNYRYDFYNLHIDQAMVRAFILPGGFSPGILPFIKWKHENNRQIKLFCDNKTHGNALSRIYPDCIVNNTFNKMEYNTGEELVFSNSGRSSNLMVRYKKVAPCAKELSLVYINDYSGLEEYIALEADLFMMTSNVYSGALPLLKNIETPVVIISNGEKDAAVSASPLVPLLQPLVQYELKKYETEASFLQDLIAHIYDDRILDLLKDWSPSRISGLKKILPRPKEASLEELISIYNTKAMLSLELCTAANSSYAKKLLSVIGLITKKYDEAITAENFKFRFKVNLALLRNRVYKIYIPLVEEEDEPFPVEIFDEITEENLANCQTFKDESVFRTYSEIIADRERLRRLLALYYEKDPQRKKETKALQKSINERKELFAERDLSPDKSVIKAELRKIRLKKIKKGLLILFILIILFGVYYWGSIFYLQYKTREQEELARKKIEAEKHRIENLVKNYKIHVSEYDIYIYANKVARKNGFAPLELKYLRKKNPNWIYPGNILYLKDGEKIKVKKGNTLWGLSEKKLMKGHLRFYSLIDKIKESGINKELLQSNLLKAKKMAFSKKHFELLEKIKKNTLPGNCQPKINK